MLAERIQVQSCGCIALPAALAASYGTAPGVVLSVESDPERQALTLQVVERAPAPDAGELTACPLEP